MKKYLSVNQRQRFFKVNFRFAFFSFFEKIMEVDKSVHDALKELVTQVDKRTFDRAVGNAKRSLESVQIRRDIEENIVDGSDDLDGTVRLTFPQSGKLYLRSEVLESLLDGGLSARDIKAI